MDAAARAVRGRAPYVLAAVSLLILLVVVGEPPPGTKLRSASPDVPAVSVTVETGIEPTPAEEDAPPTTSTSPQVTPVDGSRRAARRTSPGAVPSTVVAPTSIAPASDPPPTVSQLPAAATTSEPSQSRCQASVRRRLGPVSDLGTYVAGSSGQEPMQVTAGIDPGVWSPDGSRLLFRADHGNRRTMSLCVLEQNGTAREIRVVPFSGGPSQQSWVDNTRVILHFGGEYSNLGVLDVDTGSNRVLLERGSLFSVSPDGRTLVASLTHPQPQKLLLVDIGDGATRSLVDLPHELSATALQWLPDGAGVSYLADGLYTVRTADGSRTRIAGTDSGVGAYGWSSDGRTLAILDYGTGGGPADLVVANSDGSTRRTISTGAFQSLRWKAGTRALAVTQRTDTTNRVSVVNPDDGSLRTLIDISSGDATRIIIDRFWTPGADRVEFSFWQRPSTTS